MEDEKKTKKQLLEEIKELRQSVAELKGFEEEIKQTRVSQEKFTKAFLQNSIPVGITTLKEGRFVDVSNAFLSLMGRKRNEVIGHTSLEIGFVTEEQRASFFNELKKRGRIENLEMEVRTKGGALRHGLFNAVMINLNKEKYLLTVMNDITDRKRAEEALSRSEALFRAVVEDQEEMICRFLPDSTLTFVNDAYCRYYGKSRDELLGEKFMPLITEEDREIVAKGIASLCQEKPIQMHDQRSVSAGGEVRWQHWMNRAFFDDQGRLIELQAVGRDITERKRAEEVLRESEKKYRLIVETANEGIWAIDGERISTFVNPQMAKLFGYAPEEMIGKHITFFMFPEDLPAYEARMEKRVKGAGGQYEQKFRHKNDTPVLCMVSAQSRMDEKGTFLGSFAMLTDITDRKRVEQVLRESEERYRTVLDEMEEGYQEVDLDGNFTFFNEAFLKIFGYSAEEMMGKNFSLYAAKPEIAKEVYRAYNRMYRTGIHIKNFEWDIIRKDGDRRTIEFFASLLRDSNGHPTGFRGIVRDITDRRRVEQALKESEEKYRNILESMRESYFETDLRGNMTFCNPMLPKSLGYSPEEMAGMNHRMYMDPENAEIVERNLRDVYKENIPSKVISYEVIRKDRTNVHVESSFSQIKNKDGHSIGYRGISRDITERKRAEEVLRESEKQYRTLFEAIADTVFLIDQETGNLMDVNPAATRMYGFNREEFLRMTTTDVSAEPEKTAEATNEPVPFIPLRYHRHKDGSVFPVELTASSLELRGRNAIIATARDITDRKKAEDALREAEEKYRTILETIEEGYFEVDIAGNFAFFNESVCRLLGYSQEEMMGMNNRQYTDAESAKTLYRAFNKVYTTGKPTKEFDWEVIRKDGTKRFVEASVSLIRDSGDTPIGFRGIVRDITERKRAEEALRESEEKYREIFDSSNDAIVIQNIATGSIIDVNKTMLEMYGYADKQETLKCTIEDLSALEEGYDEEKIKEMNQKAIDSNSNTFEWRAKKKDGEIFWAQVSLQRSHIGGVERILSTVHNITQHKQAEEERKVLQERLQRSEKMEALGTLAGGVAHDLNNVLGLVVGYAELLLMDVDESSPIRPSLVTIMSGGQRAAAIVQDLLTLARRGVPGRKVLNLNRIIADSQQLPEFEKLSSHHSSIRIKTNLEPDLLNISGSAVHLGKTLFNLVSNASESMTKGGIVTIKTANQYLDKPIQGYDEVQEGGYVVLSVSDTGEGIHDADLKRIFEPFYTKKVMGRSGTGLGLAVVWGTVKDHNGYINVKSEEGKGSTFTLYFPVTREDISAEASAISISEYMGKGESILVVDDVKGQRDLAATMLRKLNYNVSSVPSGEEAIVYLKEHKVDLILLDMIMDPGMDGLDTYKKVLEIHPQQKAIIVSGFSETDRVITAQTLGAGAYVRKPYIIEKLGLAVKKELERVA